MGVKKIIKFDDIKIDTSNMTAEVSMKELSKRFNKAQFELDSAIMTSMERFMPMQSGKFINRVKAKSAAVAGTGNVYAAVGPEGRFLYEGKTMVDSKTGSPWARKGAKKVLVSEFQGKTDAKENLEYSGSGTDHWFDKAKVADGEDWKRLVKKTAGGG